MASGLERRDVVQVAKAQENASPSAPQINVMSPRAASQQYFAQKSREQNVIMNAVSQFAEGTVKNFQEKQNLKGQLAYHSGKTEEDLVSGGASDYTLEGFRVTRANAEATRWYQMELEEITQQGKTLTPEQYQGYLGEKFSGMLDEFGKDEQSRKIIGTMSTNLMTKLVASQTKEHMNWREEQTALAYGDNLKAIVGTSDASEQDVTTWLDNDIVKQLPLEVRNATLSKTIADTLDEDNGLLFETVNKRGLGSFKFSESQREAIDNAYAKFDKRSKQKQKQEYTDAIAAARLEYEETGNLSLAKEKLEGVRKQYKEQFGTASVDNMESTILGRHKARSKEQATVNKVRDAIAVGNISDLSKTEQNKAYKLMDAEIEATIRASNPNRSEAELADAINKAKVANIATYKGVNDTFAKSVTGNLNTGVIDEETGSVSDEAKYAFDAFLNLKNVGGLGLAKKHLTDKGVQRKIELATVLYDATGNAAGALSRAELLYNQDKDLTLDKRLESFEKSVRGGALDDKLDKLEDRIDPDFFSSVFGSNAIDWFNDTTGEEIKRAVSSPRVRNALKSEATKRMLAMPSIDAEQALDMAYADVIQRGDFVLGTYVIPPEGRSIKEDMGINTGDYNVVNESMIGYLQEYGKDLFKTSIGEDKEFGDTPWDNWSYEGIQEESREVPYMDIQYDSVNKQFHLYAFRRTGFWERRGRDIAQVFTDAPDLEELEPINVSPVTIPASLLGMYWKEKHKPKDRQIETLEDGFNVQETQNMNPV